MLGIDITKKSRFENPNDTFIKKILHPDEMKGYEKSVDKARFLAARWSIKEALFKADNKYFHFNKINITKHKKVYKFDGYEISTSTEDDYYIAIVYKEKNETNS